MKAYKALKCLFILVCTLYSFADSHEGYNKNSEFYTRDGITYLTWKPQRQEYSIYQDHFGLLREMMDFANPKMVSENLNFPNSNSCENWTVDNFKEYAFYHYETYVQDESCLEKSSYCDMVNGHLVTISPVSQKRILEQYHLYWNKNFIQFIRGFDQYESHILKLQEELSETCFLGRVGKWWIGKYCSGLKDIIAEKAASIHQERKYKAQCIAFKKKQEQKRRLKQQKEQDREIAYQRAMDVRLRPQFELEQKQYAKDIVPCVYAPQKQYDAQYQALQQIQEKVVWSHQSYKISPEANQIIHKYSIDAKIIEELDGHQLQHVIHQEFIEIINTTAQNQLLPENCEETVMNFAEVGLIANKDAYCSTAIKVAHFCWGLLTAAGEGIVTGVQRAVAPVVHPIQIAVDIGQTLKSLGHIFYTLGHDFNLYIKCSSVVNFNGGLEFMLDDAAGLSASGRSALSEALGNRHRDSEDNKALWAAHYERRQQQIETVAVAVQEQLAQMEVRDIVREGVAFIVDIKASAKLLTAMNGILKHAGKHVVQQVKKLKKSKKLIPVVATSEGLHFSIVDEAFKVAENDSISLGKPANKIQESLSVLQKKFKVAIEGIEEILPEVAKLNNNDRSHILQQKHAWNRLVHDENDWDAIARLISKVLKEGIEEPHKKTSFKKILKIGGETLEVTFSKSQGKIMIGNGWIRSI